MLHFAAEEESLLFVPETDIAAMLIRIEKKVNSLGDKLALVVDDIIHLKKQNDQINSVSH